MISTYLIEKYKSRRKQSYLAKIGDYKYKYAFVGAGNHSIANLYPCIRYLNVPLKYICTKNKKNAQTMASGFQGCAGTNDISDILQDDDVKGVFICTQAHLQFELVKTFLSNNKHVFVEKPPAFSSAELNELIKIQGNNLCLPALQRRFAVITKFLKKYTAKIYSYNYRYLTGPYPEGDHVYELFIHPVDNVVQLFGQAKIINIVKTNSGNNFTYFLNLVHSNNIYGAIELSTDYSWATAQEYLEINTEDEILQSSYPNMLTGTKKGKTFLNMPLDKLFKNPVTQHVYFKNNSFSPTIDNNNLLVQGFLGEIEHFVRAVEENKPDEMLQLSSLQNTYEILDRLKATR